MRAAGGAVPLAHLGKPLMVKGVSLFRLRNGRIMAFSVFGDAADQLILALQAPTY